MKLTPQIEEQLADCATWWVNRIEGKTEIDLDARDKKILADSIKNEGPRGLIIACQVGGCTVDWAINRDENGVMTREMRMGLPLCPDM